MATNVQSAVHGNSMTHMTSLVHQNLKEEQAQCLLAKALLAIAGRYLASPLGHMVLQPSSLHAGSNAAAAEEDESPGPLRDLRSELRNRLSSKNPVSTT